MMTRFTPGAGNAKSRRITERRRHGHPAGSDRQEAGNPALKMMARVLLCGTAIAAVFSGPAYAYRPFDGTDADVAGPGEVALELGYFHYLREGERKSISAPANINFGLKNGGELVVEGRVRTRLKQHSEDGQTTLEDAAISYKHLLRNGILQEKSGPSIAAECGVLLPTVEAEKNGVSCSGILSQRWHAATVHFNAAIGRNREGNSEKLLGAIAEGPAHGKLIPVAESFILRESAGGKTNSALVGLIWTANDSLAFDIALRKAHTNEGAVTEIRAGLSWILSAHH